MTKHFTVTNELEGKRLDLFLAFMMPEVTRSQVKKIIEANNVKVNERVEFKANYKVKEEDIVTVDYEKQVSALDDISAEEIELEIVYEDEDLIAVNKQEGMVVHPATGNFSGTLVNALLFRLRNLKNVGPMHRAGLINRIDKGTSGLVLVGKSNKALWFYSKQFANRLVKKTYIAVVPGDFRKALDGKKTLTISNYLARNPVKRKKYSEVQNGKGKLAKTSCSFEGISKNGDYSLVLAKPITGRTHQIRVHLASLGYPILGDDVYSGRNYDRLMLHSYKIKLQLLNGKSKMIKAPVRDVFMNFLEKSFSKTIHEKFTR
ncbi:RluA family pseudouridine synthase [Candidatus Dojkabacteria bacterium]|nr:RluA family pseudouridine synthase [Candidatus Dojkabacteria bacterium]